jgi:hypothetical protein
MNDFSPQVMGRYLTNQAIEKITSLLLDKEYLVRLVHRDGYSSEHPTISRNYTIGDLRKPGTTKFLRLKNWEGYHVFFRPMHPGYVRIDDLCEDDIDLMRSDGIEPCAVVETSEGLFHAWLRLMRRKSTVVSPEENGVAARLLSERYNGDKHATGAMQLGRLPGFRNVKHCYEDSNGGHPLVRIRGRTGTCAPEWLLDEIRAAAASGKFQGNTLHEQDELSGAAISIDEATLIYCEAVKDLTKRFPDFHRSDRSRLDFSVARWLAMRGFSVPDANAVLMAGSEKAKDRGAGYASSTVARAFDI